MTRTSVGQGALRHELPTQLNMTPAVVGGLTLRGLGCLLVGAAIAYLGWTRLEFVPWQLRLALVAVPLLIAFAFAKVQIEGHGIETWLLIVARYAALPRRAVWRPREPRMADWLPDREDWVRQETVLTWGDDAPTTRQRRFETVAGREVRQLAIQRERERAGRHAARPGPSAVDGAAMPAPRARLWRGPRR